MIKRPPVAPYSEQKVLFHLRFRSAPLNNSIIRQAVGPLCTVGLVTVCFMYHVHVQIIAQNGSVSKSENEMLQSTYRL